MSCEKYLLFLSFPHWCFMSRPDVPDRRPDCAWAPARDPSQVWFNCTWSGAYPTPTLLWGDGDDQGDPPAQRVGSVYASDRAESLSLMLNRSALSDGQTLRCAARHPALAAGTETSCSFTLSKRTTESLMRFPLATLQVDCWQCLLNSLIDLKVPFIQFSFLFLLNYILLPPVKYSLVFIYPGFKGSVAEVHNEVDMI